MEEDEGVQVDKWRLQARGGGPRLGSESHTAIEHRSILVLLVCATALAELRNPGPSANQPVGEKAMLPASSGLEGLYSTN